MAKRYGYGNAKGGVLKTTMTAYNSVIATLLGKRVCVLDLNGGQANLTYYLGYDPASLKHTVFTYLAGKSSFEETVLHTYYDKKSGIFFHPANSLFMKRLGIESLDQAGRGPDLLPNNNDMDDISEELLCSLSAEKRDFLLRDRLREIDGLYDEFHMDTGPSLGKIVDMMFLAATDIIIPVVGENLAIQGLLFFSKKLAEARLKNHDLAIAGILFSRVRYKSHREIIFLVEKHLVQQINSYFDEERMQTPEKYEALAGLNISCFTGSISESAEFGNVTSIRANLLLASPLHMNSLEHWQCYVELLRKSQGSGLLEASQYYNKLAERYNQKIADEELAKLKKKTQKGRKTNGSKKISS